MRSAKANSWKRCRIGIEARKVRGSTNELSGCIRPCLTTPDVSPMLHPFTARIVRARAHFADAGNV